MNLSDLKKLGVALVLLSLFLPWASRWEYNAHLFLYGSYVPIVGFTAFSIHWLWLVPFLSSITGSALIFSGCFVRKISGSALIFTGSCAVLLGCLMFSLWFSPNLSEVVMLAGRPSLGFALALLGALSATIGAASDLISLWSN